MSEATMGDWGRATSANRIAGPEGPARTGRLLERRTYAAAPAGLRRRPTRGCEWRSEVRELRPQWQAMAVFIFAMLACTLSACSEHPTRAGSSSTSYGSSTSAEAKAALFIVASDQMAHIQVVPAEVSDLPRVLRLTGSVTYNSFETTPVITQAGGPVSRILSAPGDQVHPGQPMLYVSSPDYAQLRTNFLKARDAYLLARRNYERQKDLYLHHAIATRDLEQSESEQAQAKADMEAAFQAVKVLGVSDPEQLVRQAASPEIPLLAPVAGEVVERLVGPGQVLQAATTQCFTISNMDTVWVLANVYEHDLGYVHLGDRVAIQTEAYPDSFRGSITYLGAALDPNSRTLQVRVVTRNPGHKLKKDMYVSVTVRAGTIPHAVSVPDSAVLRNNENQPVVYVAAGNNQFAQRLVNVGDSIGGRTLVVSGLQAGERVVADGSLFLQFENSLQK